ncbi:MAG: restriction endonuclease subunit S, partial [Planctomycetota bacterium]
GMTTATRQATAKGVVPSGWQLARLGDRCEHSLGKMLDRQKNRDTERLYLGNPSVQWLGFDLTDLRTIRIEDHESERCLVKPGDVIGCERGEAGRAAIWNAELEEVYIQKTLHRVRVGPELVSRFLEYWLMRDAKSGNLSRYFAGTSISHFTGQELHRYKIPLPPLRAPRCLL